MEEENLTYTNSRQKTTGLHQEVMNWIQRAAHNRLISISFDEYHLKVCIQSSELEITEALCPTIKRLVAYLYHLSSVISDGQSQRLLIGDT